MDNSKNFKTTSFATKDYIFIRKKLGEEGEKKSLNYIISKF